MSNTLRVLLVSLGVMLAVGALFAQSDPEVKPAWPAYLFSILLGFGTGPYWVGGNGNLFLVSDLSCVGFVAIGSVIVYGCDGLSSRSTLSGEAAGYLVIGAAAITYSIFRIWELLEVFNAVDKAKKAGLVADFNPIVTVNPTSLELDFRLRL